VTIVDLTVFDAANIQRMVDQFSHLSEQGIYDEVAALRADQRSRIFSMAGYATQLSNSDFKTYIDILNQSAIVTKGLSLGSPRMIRDSVGAEGGLYWSMPLFEDACARADSCSTRKIYESCVAIIECLGQDVMYEGVSAITSQRPLSYWAVGLMYLGDGTLEIELDPGLIKFMNKVVVNQDEGLFNAMVHALKKRSAIETQGQGLTASAQRLAHYLDNLISSIGSFSANNKLKIFPSSMSKVLSNMVHLYTHAGQDDHHLLIPARDRLVEVMTDPDGFGKSWMQKHLQASGAAHNLSHMAGIRDYFKSEYVTSGDFPVHLQQKVKFAIAVSTVNACAKLLTGKEDKKTIKRRVNSLMTDEGDEFVGRLIAQAGRPARALLEQVVHEMRPQFRHLMSEKGISGMLEADLGL
jgi:hypothetical protein